ncbi:NADPH-dependent pterin aldehyde reductase [Linum perenne]
MTAAVAASSLGLVNRAGGSGGKKVLITGVSRGLGRALAEELAKRGHTVIGCSRTQEKLNSLRSELTSSDRHLLIDADIRSDSSVGELARVVMEKKGVPDIIGVANVLRHFIPLMLPSKQGIIVNISSGWGRSGAALVLFSFHCSLFTGQSCIYTQWKFEIVSRFTWY